MRFFGFEFQVPWNDKRQGLVDALQRRQDSPCLVLNTCQRLEVYGPRIPRDYELYVSRSWDEVEALERLARIAAGLESRVLGELEILGQVREAYKIFHKLYRGDQAQLDRSFQKALALARTARKKSGIDRNLTSIGALAARELLDRIQPGKPVAVVGSGSLASSVARYLSKRGKSTIRIASRCPDNAMNLALKVGGFGFGLDNLSHLFHEVAGVITATAAPHPVVFPHHLHTSVRPLFICDLGVPPDCNQDVQADDDVIYRGLEDIEAQVQTSWAERRLLSESAADLIQKGALRLHRDSRQVRVV